MKNASYFFPNENREVLVYDHFAGDNSYLKFIIKFKRKKNVFLTSIYCNFLVWTLHYFQKYFKKKFGQKNLKRNAIKSSS